MASAPHTVVDLQIVESRVANKVLDLSFRYQFECQFDDPFVELAIGRGL